MRQVLLLSLFAAPASAQLPLTSTLLVDIHQGASPYLLDSDPSPLAETGGLVYFGAEIPIVYRRPFVTNGTPAGTLDVNTLSGTNYGHPYDAVALPNGVVVVASDSADYGPEVFAMGAGITGIQLLKDINPGPEFTFGFGSSDPSGLIEWKGEAWFFADDGVHGDEIWRSDGTTAGTVQAFDLAPLGGISNGGNSLVVAASKLFFTTQYPDPALYVLANPTSTPTKLAVISDSTTSSYVYLAPVGHQLAFTGETTADGIELWVSDGTAAGTGLLIDLYPGPNDSRPRFLGSGNGRVWFEATAPLVGKELFVTDGTAAGTHLVKDIQPGGGSGVSTSTGIVIGTGFLFTADNGLSGRELWFTDGTTAGTNMVLDIQPGPGAGYPFGYFEFGGAYWFAANNGATGTELWRSDGTIAGTALFADLQPGPESSYPYFAGQGQGYVVLSVDDGVHGVEPWVSDGTVAGTQLLKNLYPDPQTLSSYPDLLREFRDAVLFRAMTAAEGNELWTTDGTAAGTQLVSDMDPGPDDANMFPFAELSNGLLLSAATIGTGQEVWFTDGTTAGTYLVHHFDNGYAQQGIFSAVVLSDVAYFEARAPSGYELWASDGTAAGTHKVGGQPPLQYWGLEADGVLGGEFFFRANDFNVLGQELYRSDGTGAGTVLVKDINPGSAHSVPQLFRPVNGGLVFSAESSAAGRELWFTNGTTVGTQLLLDILPGSAAGLYGALVPYDGRVVFTANDGIHGFELWTSDGTTAGTAMLKDVLPGPDGGYPWSITRSGPWVWFWTHDAAGDKALWRTDGTAAGTVLVKSFAGSTGSFLFEALHAVGDGGHVVFRYDDGVHGPELWISDGTDAGTYLLADSTPGLAGSYGDEFARIGGQLLFVTDDGAAGHELHTAPLDLFGGWVSQVYGTGCGASIGTTGSMTLGSAITIDFAARTPFAPSMLHWSNTPAWGELAPGCGLHLGSLNFLGSTAADATGFAQLGFTIPSNPGLVGKPVYFQYAALSVGGPYLGLFELSQGLELVVAP